MTEIKRKFNVGDKVRILEREGENASLFGVCVGDIVEVVNYKHDDACMWDEDDCKYRPVITTSLDSDNRYWSFFEESALELVEKANVVPLTKEKTKSEESK